MVIKKPKGTKDLLFEDIYKWQIVENKIKNLLENYNYQEIRTPIFEYSDIFYHSAPYSDIVTKETFNFKDKKGETLVLRPEGTAPVIRSYIEHKLDYSSQLIKFYYYGPFFRYERPQKGRYRQFHQIGAELINFNHYLSKIEIILLIQDILTLLDLNHVKIQINNLGNLETRCKFLSIFKNYLKKYQTSLCTLCLKRIEQNILRILDCKICSQKDFLKTSPLILDYLSIEEKKQFEQLLEILSINQINFNINPYLVRGLDYYTDLVFEITVLLKNQGINLVLGGGGSYYDLVHILGGKAKKGIGFALGMERLIIALEDNGFFNNLIKSIFLEVYVLVIHKTALLTSFSLLRELRQNQIKAEMNYDVNKFTLNLTKALRNNPRYIIFIGEQEIEKKQYILKNIYLRKKYILKPTEIINFLKKELAK
ncbi:MAG: histidine--tRNA ligase [Vigna little leaf phytoplasma]|nr:histidine--tRNA ligase [Vigna little leaf phytoplasma]